MITGTEFVLDGVVREGRKVLKHRIVSLVTDLKKVVNGIPTVVVWERDFSLGRLQEKVRQTGLRRARIGVRPAYSHD